MICRIDLPVCSGWYCLPSGGLQRMVWRRWKSKVRLVWIPCHSPFCCLCCAFSDSLAVCAGWCVKLPALLSHGKSCEFPGIRIRPCPCQMNQLSCLTCNSWSLLWTRVLKDQSQTLFLLLQIVSLRLRESISAHIHCLAYNTNDCWLLMIQTRLF